MKRHIYIILFVFGTLFCQAFGAQYEVPIFEDTICVTQGENIRMEEYVKPRILELLQKREDSIWSECCDVTVTLEGNPKIELDRKEYSNWLDNLFIDKNKEVVVTVTYKRLLTCSKISTEKDGLSPAPLAMWHLFGKLLSNIDTARAVKKISDEATATTLHSAKFYYNFELALPENIDFKIQGDSCFNGFQVALSVDSAFLPYVLEWKAEGVEPNERVGNPAFFYNQFNDRYLYSILCTVRACKGETRSAKFDIGYPTPIPEVEDLGCIASNETSFDVKVKEPNTQLSYHWIVEDLARGVIVDTQQGASVTMKIPQNDSVKVKLVSTGGCKASDTIESVLHRNVVEDERSIYLQGDTNCLFKDDTLRLSLRNAPHEVLVWQSGEGSDTLSWNSEYGVQGKDSICAVSVRSLHCPETVSKVFNIRKDFKVSLASNPTCIRVNKGQVIKLASNGINPEVHWSGNGVVIDSTKYSKKDSILVRLVNPGDPNLYVAVTARECGRESDTLLMLRPLPEQPRLDSIWNALTPCIPLGIVDTIELKVQPQEGVKFKWDWAKNYKFQRITKVDSSSILVATNFGLSDSEEDKTINVNVYAYTVGCTDSVAFPATLYAIGAGLGEEWHIDSKLSGAATVARRMVGFCQNSPDEIQKEREELDSFAFFWTSSLKINGSNSLQILQFVRPSLPFDVACVLTNKNTSCYSYYSRTIEESSTLQNIATSSSAGTSQNIVGNEDVQGMSYATPPQEEKHRGGFWLVPNPTHGNSLLYLEKAAVDRRAVIEILTEQGVCLYRRNADADVTELPTARFRSGLYFVRVRAGEEDIIVKKLIVQ